MVRLEAKINSKQVFKEDSTQRLNKKISLDWNFLSYDPIGWDSISWSNIGSDLERLETIGWSSLAVRVWRGYGVGVQTNYMLLFSRKKYIASIYSNVVWIEKVGKFNGDYQLFKSLQRDISSSFQGEKLKYWYQY